MCLTTLVFYEWFHKDPIVDVRLFKNRNFATANMMLFMVGAMAFATTVLMPEFLQTIMGYTAENAGLVLSAAAILLLFELPFVGRLTSVFQLRYLIAFGWFGLAIGMYVSVLQFNQEMSFGHATWLRIVQYVPLGFVFVPTTTAAYIGIQREKSNAVAGLVNFTRNIGSSVGISVVNSLLTQNTQVNHSEIAEHVTLANRMFEVPAIAQFWNPVSAAGRAALDAIVTRQAQIIAYIDDYKLLMIATLAVIPLLIIFTKPPRDVATDHMQAME